MKRPALILSLTLIALLLAVLVPAFLYSPEETQAPVIENRDEWVVYENEEFSFSLEHPPEWTVHSRNRGDIPTFHFLPPSVDIDEEEVLTHHSDRSHVSVFPHGYPTEGIFGQARHSRVIMSNAEVEDKTDYILGSEEAWGTMMTFSDAPEGWTEAGFIWSRADVEDFEFRCFDGDDEVPRESCDPVRGHEFRHFGSLDRLERRIQEEVLSSFTFTD